MDTTQDLQKKNEELTEFVNAKFKFYLFNNIAITSITEYVLYLAQDKVLAMNDKKDGFGEHMELSIHYFDQAKARLISKFEDEDMVLDFMASFLRNTKRTVTALINAVTKKISKQGFEENAETAALLSVSSSLMEMTDMITNATKEARWFKLIPKKKQLNPFLDMVDLSHKHLSTMFVTLTSNDCAKHLSCDDITERYSKIMQKLADNSLYEKATNYSIKENRK